MTRTPRDRIIPLRQGVAVEPLTDEALALACSTADPAAISELFERFRRPVARYLSRLTDSPDDIEDCLQTTFLEVARGTAQFSGRSSVKTWLFGVATNVVRHHYRAAARRSRLGAALSICSPDATHPDAQQRFDARQRLARLQRGLQELSSERREAFVLCELEGLSAREAASVLASTETAVWKRVSEARRALLARVREEGR